MTSSKKIVAVLLAAQAVAGPLTLRDLAHRSNEQIRGPRLVWKLWAGTNLAGVAAYWLIGRKKNGELALTH